MPASFAASVNVSHFSVTGLAGVTPGSIWELPAASVTESPNRSLPVHSVRMRPAAALYVLWPETYSGKGGVGNVASWYGSHCEPSISTVPLSGPPQARIFLPLYNNDIAVTGRTESKVRLASHAAILVSIIAFESAKNIFTSSSSV